MNRKNRNEYVRSPVTNRQIKVGGRAYNKLVKEGYFEEGYDDDNILQEFGGEETENMVLMKDKIDELNGTLPKSIRAVRGRGRYKNKIVKKYSRSRKQPKPKRKKTIERQQARQILDQIADLDFEGDPEGQLAELIRQQSQLQEEDDDEVDYEDTEVDDTEIDDTEIDDYSDDDDDDYEDY